MRHLTFHGPGHRLRLPSGRTVDRGATGEVTNDDAAQAERAPNVRVTVHSGGDAGDSDQPEATTGEGSYTTNDDVQED